MSGKKGARKEKWGFVNKQANVRSGLQPGFQRLSSTANGQESTSCSIRTRLLLVMQNCKRKTRARSERALSA